MSLKETLGPSVETARDGFAVYPALRGQIERNAERYREEWPSTAAIYLEADGSVPKIGKILKQPDWATTMQGAIDAEMREAHRGREAGLRAALDYWYRGPVAEKAVTFSSTTEVHDASGRPHRGLLDADDFASFRTKVEDPVTANYRGIDVYKCGPWNQGPVFLQQLMLLEGFDLAKMGHNSTEYVHTVVEAAKLAYADREQYYGDPAFVDVPLDRLLSKEYAAKRRDADRPARGLG